jgi:hypothetical protein
MEIALLRLRTIARAVSLRQRQCSHLRWLSWQALCAEQHRDEVELDEDDDVNLVVTVALRNEFAGAVIYQLPSSTRTRNAAVSYQLQ